MMPRLMRCDNHPLRISIRAFQNFDEMDKDRDGGIDDQEMKSIKGEM